MAEYRHYLDDLLYTHDGDNRGIYGPDHDPARDNMASVLCGLGIATELERFRYEGNDFYNVIATKTGEVTPERQYIISGHFDSWGNPGADDDGSGCAAVMEIARVLSRYRFESTIIFVGFDAEERGMIGSRAYVDSHRNDDVRGMISVDQIGYDAGLGYCDIYGHTASAPLKVALARAVVAYGSGLTARVLEEWDISDHAPFEWHGFQACFLIEGDGPDVNPCFHLPCDSVDNPDNLGYEYAIQIARSVTGWLVEQAGLLGHIADVDGDGVVDFRDLLLLLGAWGECEVDCPADLDGDGLVDLHDVLILLANWGPGACCFADC